MTFLLFAILFNVFSLVLNTTVYCCGRPNFFNAFAAGSNALIVLMLLLKLILV